MKAIISSPARLIFALCLLILPASLGFAQANNPVPLINQPLVPDAVAPGGPAFTLTVNGTGFVAGSVVNWDGSARATTFVSGSQLTAQITASDIAVGATGSVTVSSGAPGGGVSNVVYLPVLVPGPGVATTQTSFSQGIGASGITSGDFNGDGKPDLAVLTTNCNSLSCLPGTLSIFLGQSNGTFKHLADYTTLMMPNSVVAADFNGDGKLDLAVANQGTTHGVSIFLGNGDGTFTPAANVATTGGAVVVAAADVNKDGKLDLLVGIRGHAFDVALGNGDGTFGPAMVITYANTIGFPNDLAVGDFNGDGNLDVALSSTLASSGGVAVLLGNGDGTFQPATFYDVGIKSAAVVAADFNGDGKLDLAAAGHNVLIMLGNGDGTFQSAVSYPAPLFVNDMMAADVNGDGKLDLVAAEGSTRGGSVSFFLGNGDGTFQPHLDAMTVTGSSSLTLADFNDDGAPDLVVSGVPGNSFTVLLQKLLPAAAVSPSTLSFGSQIAGTTSNPQTATLTNTGRAPLTGIALLPPADFSANKGNCPTTLAPGASCTISVTFTPRFGGSFSESLTVSSNAANGPQTVTLTGTGLDLQTKPQSVNFGVVKVNSVSHAVRIIVKNISKAQSPNVTIRSVSIVSGPFSADFAEANDCAGTTLGANATCTILTSFRPLATGLATDCIQIVTDFGEILNIPLSGTGD